MKRQKTKLTRPGFGLFLLILMAVLPVGCDTSSNDPESTSGTQVRLAFTTQPEATGATRQESTRAVPANIERIVLSVSGPGITTADNLSGIAIDLTAARITLNVPVGSARVFAADAFLVGSALPNFSGIALADVPSTGTTVTIIMNPVAGGGSPTPLPTVCANIAGTWNVTENVTVTCTVAGEPPETDTTSGTGRTTITQNGCAISYVVPEVGLTRTGVIDGQHVRFTGPLALALASDVQFSRNSVTIEGDLQGNSIVAQGSGTAAGTAQGSSFVCTASSTATFTRVGTTSVARAQSEQPFEEPSLIFLDGAVHLFTVIIQ